MQTLLAILCLFLMQSGTPSPFDGTWIIDSAATQLPDKPTVFLLANGMFGSAGQQIKADGTDQKVPETGYWDTMNVQILDARTVKIISKKAGKAMFTEVDTVSGDDKTLTQIVKDTTEAQTVTIETVSLNDFRNRPNLDSMALIALARTYSVLDEKDEAFAFLEAAYQRRVCLLVFLGVIPTFDNIRTDPRYADLLHRIGLPEAVNGL